MRFPGLFCSVRLGFLNYGRDKDTHLHAAVCRVVSVYVVRHVHAHAESAIIFSEIKVKEKNSRKKKVGASGGREVAPRRATRRRCWPIGVQKKKAN